MNNITINPPNRSTTRLPSWDTPPPPRPRRYVGPKRFGYPPIRRDPIEDLEVRITQLERAIASAGLPVYEESGQ